MTEHHFLIRLHALAQGLHHDNETVCSAMQLRDLCVAGRDYLSSTPATLHFINQLADFLDPQCPDILRPVLIAAFNDFYCELLQNKPLDIIIIASADHIAHIKTQLRPTRNIIHLCINTHDENSDAALAEVLAAQSRAVLIYDASASDIMNRLQAAVQGNVLCQYYYQSRTDDEINLVAIRHSLAAIKECADRLNPAHQALLAFWQQFDALTTPPEKVYLGAAMTHHALCCPHFVTRHTDYPHLAGWLMHLAAAKGVSQAVIGVEISDLVSGSFTDPEELLNFLLLSRYCAGGETLFDHCFALQNGGQPLVTLVENLMFYAPEDRLQLKDLQRTMAAVLTAIDAPLYAPDRRTPATAAQHSARYRYSDFIEASFRAIAQMAASGMNLTFVLLPCPPAYWQALDRELVALARSGFQRLQSETVTFVDLSEDTAFAGWFTPEGRLDAQGETLLSALQG